MANKRVFKNHATKIIIRKVNGGYIFVEEKLKRDIDHWSRLKPTYEEIVSSLQRYSKKHYGEKAI